MLEVCIDTGTRYFTWINTVSLHLLTLIAEDMQKCVITDGLQFLWKLINSLNLSELTVLFNNSHLSSGYHQIMSYSGLFSFFVRFFCKNCMINISTRRWKIMTNLFWASTISATCHLSTVENKTRYVPRHLYVTSATSHILY